MAAATPTVSGLQTGDTVTGLAETYDTANAGTGKILSVAAYTVNDGNSGNNYTVTTNTNATGVISALPVVLTGSRTYDGATDAAAAILTVANDLDGSNLTISGTGTLSSKNAGSEAFASIGTLTLGGSAASNYTLSGITTNASSVTVNKAALTITAAANSKTYDATTMAAATPTVSGLQTGDTVTGLAETYDTANAGTGKTLSVAAYTLSDGNAGNNYAVTTQTSSTGVISALPVVLTGSRTYDGATDAASAILAVVNDLDGANLTISGTGTLSSKNAGSEAFASIGTLTLGGSAASNYSLAGVTANASAVTVNKAALTASLIGTVSKVGDGATLATLTSANYRLSGLIGTDTVTLNDPTTGTYASSQVGTGIVVTVGGLALLGLDASNYQVNSTVAGAIGTITGTASTTPKMTVAPIIFTVPALSTGSVASGTAGQSAASAANAFSSLPSIITQTNSNQSGPGGTVATAPASGSATSSSFTGSSTAQTLGDTNAAEGAAGGTDSTNGSIAAIQTAQAPVVMDSGRVIINLPIQVNTAGSDTGTFTLTGSGSTSSTGSSTNSSSQQGQ
jgi:ribosomal protein L30E